MAALTERPTILLVEDNAADAELVVDAFETAPSNPLLVVVTTGAAALARLHDDDAGPHADLVLLDLNVPGGGGLQTLAEIKADPELRRIPVVVLTTSTSQADIDGCYAHGAAAVLSKPLRLRDYREMLAAFERFWLGHVRLPARS